MPPPKKGENISAIANLLHQQAVLKQEDEVETIVSDPVTMENSDIEKPSEEV